MKLIVILDIKSAHLAQNYIKEGDVCLINFEDQTIIDKIKRSGCKILHPSDFEIDNQKIFFLSKKYKKFFFKDTTIYKYINNSFTNTFLPFYKLKHAIQKIIKIYNIKEIKLVFGNKNINFIPYYYAEGEQQIKLLYNPCWFFNYHIYHHFKRKIKVSFLQEESYIKIKFLIFSRRLPLLIAKYFVVFIKLLKWIEINNQYLPQDNHKKSILFPIRSVAQLNSITKLAQFYKKNDIQPIFLTYELLFNRKNILHNKIIKKKLFFYYLLPKSKIELFSITTKVFLKTFLQVIKEKKEYKKELVITNFEKELYKTLLERTIANITSLYGTNAVALISTEMQSPEMFIEKDVALKYNLKSINIQAQSLMHIPLPDLSYKSKFIMENLIDYNFFKKFYTSVDYWGSFKFYDILESIEKQNNKFGDEILYLSQPHEHNNQKKIIKKLAQTFPDKYIHIKLHPRDNNDYSFIKNFTNVQMLTESDIDKILKNENIGIVVSRTSSVLLNAIIYGKYAVSIQLSHYDKSSKHFFLSSIYLHVLSDLNKIHTIFSRKNLSTQSKNKIYGSKYSPINFLKWINS